MSVDTFRGRYDRNFNTLSHEEQEKLADARVLVIGLGGLGGGVCEMLARTGVGHLIVADGDTFEVSNLNRQLLSREDLIGKSKAQSAADRIKAINSEVSVTTVHTLLDQTGMARHLDGVDVAADCLDAIDTRFMLQDSACKAGVPIVSGAIAGVTGQVTTIFPGDKGYELIYGTEGESHSKGVEEKTGNIAYCALMISALQASECIKVILNRGDLLRNKLLITELWSNTFEVMDLT